MEPRVSVLMPVHNGAVTVAKAIRCLYSQTLREIEIIVVDDGSTDETPALLKSLAREDSRLRVATFATNRGIVAALNHGMKMARAPYVARMDADDHCPPERLASQLDLIESDSRLGAVSCLVEMNGDASGNDGMRRYVEWLNGLVTPEAIAACRFIESPVAHPSVLLRRAALEAVGGYRDTPWAEDYDLWLRLMESGWRIAKVPAPLLEWRDTPGRLSRRDPRYARERFIDCKAHYLARLDSIRTRGVQISGGGPTGKLLSRALLRQGIHIHAFMDVHPRRIGGRIGGIPVLSIDAIPKASPEAPIQLGAVGTPATREEVRLLLAARGFAEGDTFYCVS